MKDLIYPAVFTKEDNGYSVTFPDLAGCVTQGDTIEEAYFSAREALGLYIDGEKDLPKPTEINSLDIGDSDYVMLIMPDMEDNIIYGSDIDISQVLNGAAENKGYTKYRIAKIIGKSESYICRIFNGTRKPAVNIAKQLCELLDLDWRMFY